MEFRERALTVRVKPETVDPATTVQLRSILEARNMSLEESAPATWVIRSTGASTAPAQVATTGAAQ
jgi:general secretion pathway protein L